MATHSSILAWRIPQTEEPDGLQSMGFQIWTRPRQRLTPMLEANEYVSNINKSIKGSFCQKDSSLFIFKVLAHNKLSIYIDLVQFIKLDKERSSSDRTGDSKLKSQDGDLGGVIKQQENSKKSFGNKPDLLLYFVLNATGSPFNISAHGWACRSHQVRSNYQFVKMWTDEWPPCGRVRIGPSALRHLSGIQSCPSSSCFS